MHFAVFYEKFNKAGNDWINATLPMKGCFSLQLPPGKGKY